jgi:hypothetical protein
MGSLMRDIVKTAVSASLLVGLLVCGAAADGSFPEARTRQVLGNSSTAPGPAAPIFQPPQNSRTGSYTAASADCGSLITAGGSAFYTIAFNAASAYPPRCRIGVVNTDASACRGKSIDVNGFAAKFILWPGQTAELTNINNAWVETINPGRWRPNCGRSPLVINTDSTSGSDRAGVADGLGTGSEAFQTVNGALGVIQTYFDFIGSPQTQVRVLMAASSTDAQTVHYAPHGSNPGATGGAALTIDGNGGSLTGGVQFYYGSIVRLRNVTLSNTAGSCLVATQNAYVQVLDLVTFAACSISQITLSTYGTVEMLNNFTISGGGTYFISNLGGILLGNGVTISVSNDVAYSQAVVYGYSPGRTALAGTTWSLGGHTVTGRSYDVEGNHVLDGSATIPGSPGITASGGQAL